MTTSHEAPKKRQLPTVYTLLFIIIALMAALTWVLPAGKYNYLTAKTQQPVAAAAVADYSGDERLLPVPGRRPQLLPEERRVPPPKLTSAKSANPSPTPPGPCSSTWPKKNCPKIQKWRMTKNRSPCASS